MCGIMGFVGKSKNKNLTYELATNLLVETSTRGKDATGFYCIDSNGYIFWDKNNVDSKEFVKYNSWKKRCANSQALIGHTRMTTHGTELSNINNHPHVSDDQSLALVHNGIFSGFKKLSQDYNINLQSQCDSEVILRIIEQENNIVDGIKKVYEHSQSYYGNFACLFLEIKNNGDSFYYVFRNRVNPIVFIDLKKDLGQLFFASTEYIWKNSIEYIGIDYIKNIKVESIPEYEIWKINSNTLDIEKIKIKQNVCMLPNNYYGNKYYPYIYDEHEDTIQI